MQDWRGSLSWGQKNTFCPILLLDLSVVAVAWETCQRLGLLQNCWEHLRFRRHDSAPFRAHAALYTPEQHCPGTELSSLASPFPGAAFFPCCPFTTSETNPRAPMPTILFQGLSSPPASFPGSTCQGLLGSSAALNANVARDQLLNTRAKIHRDHPILGLASKMTLHTS